LIRIESAPQVLTRGDGGAQGELVFVLDFGSQTAQLIARRVREASVYCELVPGTTPWSELKARRPVGVILSGGPGSVHREGAFPCSASATACSSSRITSGARSPLQASVSTAWPCWPSITPVNCLPACRLSCRSG